jgi:hypothetical protein
MVGSADRFLTGVIEGFYGRSWSFETRQAYAGYLVRAGLNTCLYCPKEDTFLRKRWHEHWPEEEWQRLLAVSAAYRQQGLYWGVGLSPFALYQNYGAIQRRQLREKVARLAELNAPLLAILFDDMPGELDALASRQAEIISDVVEWMPDARVMVCPTYYSFDPVLETHFGRMPSDYWPQLGRELPAGVDVFWTGSRVCSDAVKAADIKAINNQLGRQVMLWDNYPVNDGAVRSNFLYCTALSQRDSGLKALLRGHLCNPMNQALLSLPALAGLAGLYLNGSEEPEWLEQILGTSTWLQLRSDREAFEQLGLSGMGGARREQLARIYDVLPGAAAGEVAAWLRGEYSFDPACLTD